MTELGFNLQPNQDVLSLENGDTTVHLIATYCPDYRATNDISGTIDMYALVDAPNEMRKVVTYEYAGKSLNGMSVEQYIKEGRVGLMKYVRPNHIFKLSAQLKTKLFH